MGQFNTIPPNPFPPSSESAGGSGGTPYVLPVASDEELGGVMIDGAGLEVDENGLLSVKTGDGLHTNVLGELCADSQKVDYSTAEVDTGVKWIDGKPIYSKTYSLGALPSSSTITVQNDIENFGFVVGVETMGKSSDGYSFTGYGLVMNYCSSTSFVFRTTFDATGYDGFATVYYTKTV